MLAAGDVAAVVVRAAAGDVDALERIVLEHHDDMTRVCVLVCGGDADLAQDAVQSAWPIAWRKLGTLRDAGHLRPWLITVAANEARRLIRQRRRRSIVELDVPDAESSRFDQDQLKKVQEEVADVLLYLVQFADALDIDLEKAALEKLRINEEKYPIDKSRGSSKKHSDL